MDTTVPSSDRLITFIARHREELAPHFAICVPDLALIETLNDKAREVELVANLGFAVPKTLAPGPSSAAEIEARLGLPVIIKPRSFEHLSLIPTKKVVIHDRGDLEAFCRERGPSFGRFIAQEVIPGPDDANWVVGCTFGRAHELLDCGIKRKLRMAPAHSGSAHSPSAPQTPRCSSSYAGSARRSGTPAMLRSSSIGTTGMARTSISSSTLVSR